jgi:hypothetical protein
MHSTTTLLSRMRVSLIDFDAFDVLALRDALESSELGIEARVLSFARLTWHLSLCLPPPYRFTVNKTKQTSDQDTEGEAAISQ